MVRTVQQPTVTAGGAVIGRPRKQPPADAAKRIRTLAATGYSVRGIAYRMRCGEATLSYWLTDHPKLKEAFDAGREIERHKLHNLLYVQATKHNNIVAAMFLLKARHGYREGEQEQQGNSVNITFTLPGALKPEQFTIDNEPAATPE